MNGTDEKCGSLFLDLYQRAFAKRRLRRPGKISECGRAAGYRRAPQLDANEGRDSIAPGPPTWDESNAVSSAVPIVRQAAY